jgi:glycosyltransferase involved in cell wall biosynthesis
VGEQWVLVRFHREPVGLLKFTTACSASELSDAISRQCATAILRHMAADNLSEGSNLPLASLPNRCPRRADVTLPLLSAAVCTRNGARRLVECLDALVALDYPAAQLDLLVVDNAPADDETRRVVERYPTIRYICEPRPGLDWARNRAIAEARGEILAFTDDDVSLDAGWAEAFGRLFAADDTIDAATGLVVADEMDVEPQRLFEQYGGFGRGFKREYFRVDSASGERTAERHAGAGRFGTGANMAFRRRLFDRIGRFDPALDVGTPTNGGGDLEMFFRVLKHGGILVYEPSAIARHRHRRTYAELRTQLANNGIGFYSYLVRTAEAYPDERATVIRLGTSWLWSWNVRRLLRSYVKPHDFPRDLIAAELRGSLAGLRRYRRAKEQAARIESGFHAAPSLRVSGVAP